MYAVAAMVTDVAFLPEPPRRPRSDRPIIDRRRRSLRDAVRSAARSVERWLEPTGASEAPTPALRAYPY